MTSLLARRLRTTAPLAAVALGLALGVLAEREAVRGGVFSPVDSIGDSIVGIASLTAGLVVWRRRPESRVGPLIVLVGITWFPGTFGYSPNQTLVDLVGFPLQGWQDVFLVALVLLFPTGRLGSRNAALLVGGTAFAHLVLSLDRLLLRPPEDPSSCFCVANRILPITDPGPYTAVARAASATEAAFAIAALVLVVVRWQQATGPARRALGYVTLAAFATAGLVASNRLHTAFLSDTLQTGNTMRLVLDALRITIPVALVTALVRTGRSRARVADLVVSLSRGGTRAERGPLRHALADPNVHLLRYSSEDQTYRDAQGACATLPRPDGPLAATPVKSGDTTLGVLVHDRALIEEPELLEAVVAAAGLALHNERLAAEINAQLAEVSASRQRIVEAGDAERRRLERDLHDGAQQHLIALALDARRLERAAAHSDSAELAEQLRGLATKAEAALGSARELARGIRPPVLTESGLGYALESLADASPVSVALEIDVPARLPDAVEAAAYFVAAEALTNVIKHAGATRARITAICTTARLTLCVVDDGRGGADRGGGGLLGLADRLRALGGELIVESHPECGTTVTARIPVDVPVGGNSTNRRR